MAVTMNVRVRLDLTDCKVLYRKKSNQHPLCWILIDSLKTTQIFQLKNEIRKRHQFSSSEFGLFVGGALIHDDETVDVLRENDLVKVIPASDEKLNSGHHDGNLQLQQTIENTKAAQVFNTEPEKLRKRQCVEEDDNVEAANISIFELEHSKSKKKRRKSKTKHFEEQDSTTSVKVTTVLTQETEQISPEIDIKETSSVIPCDGDEGIQVTEELPKKKRKRVRRKNKSKTETDLGIFNFTNPDIEATSTSTLVFKEPLCSFSGKHIRFDKPSAELPINEKLLNISQSTLSRPISSNSNHSLETYGQISYSEHLNSCAETTTPPKKTIQNQYLNQSFGSTINKFKEMSKECQVNSVLETKSVILLNCENYEPSLINGTTDHPLVTNTFTNSCSKLDIKNSKVLASPPLVGDVIAFKVLEISENYCPEISKYKTAKVTAYTNKDDVITLQILSQENKKKGNGKFDLVYDEDLETEEVELQNEEVTSVQLKWLDLIEPKLISS